MIQQSGDMPILQLVDAVKLQAKICKFTVEAGNVAIAPQLPVDRNRPRSRRIQSDTRPRGSNLVP